MDPSPSSPAPVRVPLTDIRDNPYQVRTTIDETALSDLVVSICDVGLLQIPSARKVGDKFELAFGHRRKQVFQRLADDGLSAFEEMPLIVLELSDREMFEIGVSENIKRAALSPIERAQALKQYMIDFGATSEQAAQLFGMKAATVRSTVRLLKLPEEDQQKVRRGELSQTQARRILKKPGMLPETPGSTEGPFDLRVELMRLLYDRPRHPDITDELLFKRVRSILEENDQLKRQIEMMNGRRLEGSKVGSRRSLQPARVAP